jgi:MFS family permease
MRYGGRAVPVGIVLWSVLAVVVDVALARVAFGAVVPSLRADLGLGLAAVGVANAANVIGYVVATPFAMAAIGRGGLRRTSVIAHLVAAAGAALVGGSASFVPLLLGRVVTGAGGAIGLVSALRLALDAVPASRRVLVSTVTWSGIGLGVLVAAAAQPALLAPGAWRGAAFAWAGATLLVALTTPRERHDDEHARAAAPLRTGYGLILAAYVAFGFAFLAYTTFLALTGTGPVAARWLWLGAAALLGGLLTLRVRRPEPAFAGVLVVAGLGALGTANHLSFGGFLVGLGLTASPALATAIVRARVGSAHANAAIAYATLAVGTGQLAGPTVAGFVADRLGVGAVPLLAAAAYGAGAVLVGCDLVRRAGARRA